MERTRDLVAEGCLLDHIEESRLLAEALAEVLEESPLTCRWPGGAVGYARLVEDRRRAGIEYHGPKEDQLEYDWLTEDVQLTAYNLELYGNLLESHLQMSKETFRNLLHGVQPEPVQVVLEEDRSAQELCRRLKRLRKEVRALHNAYFENEEGAHVCRDLWAFELTLEKAVGTFWTLLLWRKKEDAGPSVDQPAEVPDTAPESKPIVWREWL